MSEVRLRGECPGEPPGGEAEQALLTGPGEGLCLETADGVSDGGVKGLWSSSTTVESLRSDSTNPLLPLELLESGAESGEEPGERREEG